MIYLTILRLYASSEKLADIRILVIASILGRLIVAMAPAVLTGDLPRYLWEGALVRQGVNPYVLPPDSPELLGLRSELWATIEYKHLGAIYPPVAQYLLALFAGDILLWKLTLCGFEILSLFCILKILKANKKPAGYLLYYACLPLGIIEIAGSGHLEGILVSLMLSFYLLFQKLKQTDVIWRGVLLGIVGSMALLVKYNAGLFLLVISAKDWRLLRRRAFQMGLISFFSFCILFFWPFLDPAFSVFKSLQVYLEHWRFNDSLLHLSGLFMNVNWQDSRSFTPLKIGILLLWILGCLWMFKRETQVLKIVAYSYFTYLLASAVVHPWYGLWFAVFLPFVRSPVLICFALTLPLSYAAKLQHYSDVPVAIKLLEYVPVFFLCAIEIYKSARLRDTLHS